MYNQIIQYIMKCAIKHVAVNSVKYQSRILINQQNSNPNYQVVIEDDAYLQYMKTGNVNTMSLNIDILSHCGDDDNILEVLCPGAYERDAAYVNLLYDVLLRRSACHCLLERIEVHDDEVD